MRTFFLACTVLLLVSNANAATVFSSTSNAGNAAQESLWLTAIGGGPAAFSEGFESGYLDNQAVTGDIGDGLSITGIGQGGGDPKIEQGNGSIGGSNPIGNFALELADDGSFSGLSTLTLSFSNPLAYVSFYVIDAAGMVIDYGAGTFQTSGTASSGNSAEFHGLVFDASDIVTEVIFPFPSSGSAGWAVDEISWGYAPAPVPLPAAAWLFGSAIIGAGIIGRRKRQA